MNITKRTSSRIPLGYNLHPDNEHLMVEDENQMRVREEIRKNKGKLSLRKMSDYVYHQTGRRFTAMGIRHILNESK